MLKHPQPFCVISVSIGYTFKNCINLASFLGTVK